MPELPRRAFAEVLSTFVMVFAGTGAMVINDVSGGAVTHVGIALTFGLVVMAMIYAVGDLSGAHMNPAVTLGFAATGRLGWGMVAPYVLAQCAGACLASLSLRGLFPEHPTLGLTAPAGSAAQTFWIEVALTAMLMFLIMRVSTGAKEVGVLSGIAVGGMVGLEALFAGPISGASMNPARSLGPALVSQHTGDLWIYLVSTPLGALLGCAAWAVLRAPHPAEE